MEIALLCDRGEDKWLHDGKRKGVIINPGISSWAATVSLTHMGRQSTGSGSAKTAKEWDPPFRCTQPCRCVLWLALEAWPIFIQKHSAASPPSLVRGSPIVRGLLVCGDRSSLFLWRYYTHRSMHVWCLRLGHAQRSRVLEVEVVKNIHQLV